MKKWVLGFFMIFIGFGLVACNPELKDYSVEEAFALMNESIQGYLEADSLSMVYHGTYISDNYNTTETMEIKMKKMNSDNLIGKVSMQMIENSTSYETENNFFDGIVYTSRIENDQEELLKQPLEYIEYQSLYTSFFKKQIVYADTRASQIFVDEKYLTVHFELRSSEVENTFFVSTVLQSVKQATVDVTLTHKGEIVSIIVSYQAYINGILGTQSYTVEILKINRYIVIDQLSSAQKLQYVDVPADE